MSHLSPVLFTILTLAPKLQPEHRTLRKKGQDWYYAITKAWRFSSK